MLALIDALPTAIVFIEHGKVIRWNVAATSLYGWLAHEAIGQPFEPLLFEDADREQGRSILQQAADRGRWEGNFRVKRRDGIVLVSSFTASVVNIGDGNPCLAWVATDVVDQHLAEQERAVLLSAEHAVRQELEATVGMFEALIGSAPIGLAAVDLELFVTAANSTFARMLGADEIPIGGHLDDIASLHPTVAADLRSVVRTGRSLTDRTVTVDASATAERREIRADYFPIFSGGDTPTGAGVIWTAARPPGPAEAHRTAPAHMAEVTERSTSAQRRLAVLASAGSVLMTTTDVDALIERLARVLAPGAADWCVIELVDKSGIIEHVAVAHTDGELTMRLRSTLLRETAEMSEDSPTSVVRRTGQGMLLSGDELADALRRSARTPEQQAVFDEMALTSGIIVPIKSRGEYLGILSLWNASDIPLTAEDLDIAVEIAHRAALAVGRAITYRNEHLLAEQLQQALLPANLPQLDAIGIEVRYSAAADSATVGGDWYDAFQLSDQTFVISVGDVVGHDTTAAVGMSRIRYLINAFAVEGSRDPDASPQPDQILGRIDRIVYQDPSAWSTCVVAFLDLASGELRWSTAGHPPPFLIRDGIVRALDGANGTMLGVSPDRPRETATVQLYSGDRLLFYTDGLFERRGEPIDAGLTRLAENVRLFAMCAPDQFCDEITAAMFQGTTQTDDMAIIVIDYR